MSMMDKAMGMAKDASAKAREASVVARDRAKDAIAKAEETVQTPAPAGQRKTVESRGNIASGVQDVSASAVGSGATANARTTETGTDARERAKEAGVKAKERAREATQRGIARSKEKWRDIKARRQANVLLRQLGYAVYIKERQGAPSDAITYVMSELDRHVKEHGPLPVR
jgi:hypothetical protein